MFGWAPLPGVVAVAAVGIQMLRMQRARQRTGLVLGVELSATTDDELTFTVAAGQTGTSPSTGVVVRAAVGAEQVAELPPFDVPADQNHSVQVHVPRPRLGTVVPECGDQPTLYGEPLVVTATDARGTSTSAEWRERPVVRGADPARYEAMQRAWAAAGKAPRSF
jgi:hypothetical protein